MGGLSQALKGHRVAAVDTNCFIYYLEGGPWAQELKNDLFAPLEQGIFRAVTSILTLAEVLVRPKSLGREDICEEYETLLCSYPNLQIIPVNVDIAVRCAEVRARYHVRTPDALQLATALENEATLFLTNDLSLPAQVENMRIAHLKDLLLPWEPEKSGGQVT